MVAVSLKKKQAGQQTAIGQRCPTVYYPDETFWLVGAQIIDRGGQVLLDQVAAGGPAESAGLRSGDRLIALSDYPINTSSEAKQMIARYGAGTSLQVTIERSGRIELVTMLLGGLVRIEPPIIVEPPIIIVPIRPTYNPPPPPVNSYGEKYLGVYYRMLEPGDPFAVKNGALLITVWEGGAAELAGLGPGDIVLAVNNIELSQSYTLENALDTSYKSVVTLTVLKTSGEKVAIRVRLEY